jgi:1,3-beta-glucanosyltransferase GAS1
MLQNYLVCGDDAGASIDFFGLNAYEWCGDSDFNISGYSNLNSMVTDYPVPIFFSETGCNAVEPRTFQDQSAIFGPDMSPYWSGSIIYEWIQEENNYGLISYGPPGPTGFVRSGTPTPVVPDFDNLKTQWASASPESTRADDYQANVTPPACPGAKVDSWSIDGNVPLPSLNEVFTSRVMSSISAGPKASTPLSSSMTLRPSSTTPSGPSSTVERVQVATSGAAQSGHKITGMTLGLAGMMVGFAWL